MSREGCAAIARRTGERVHGSAPENCDAWLLVEHPGPWPAFGPPADVPVAVRQLLAAAPAHRVRPQLIRRPSARRTVPPHRVFVVFSGGSHGGAVWTRTAEVADLHDLLDLDLAAVGRGQRPDWGSEHHEPLLLVCTHAKREPCCARFGRPTVRALHRAFGDPVWETTHVGGDRFAANLVALPWGTYHGLVTEPVARAVGEACLRGEVDLAHFRGRSGHAAPVQAAEFFARRATGALAVDAVRVLGHSHGPSGAVSVRLEVDGARLVVRVGSARTGRPRLTSCSRNEVGDPHEFVLESLHDLGPLHALESLHDLDPHPGTDTVAPTGPDPTRPNPTGPDFPAPAAAGRDTPAARSVRSAP